jgi:hypothetical protein
MKMIGHQDVGMKLDRVDSQRFSEEAQESHAVFIAPKNFSPFIPTAHHMINGTRILDTQGPGHVSLLRKPHVFVNSKDLTPISIRGLRDMEKKYRGLAVLQACPQRIREL